MKSYRKLIIVTISTAVLCFSGTVSAQELKRLRKIISDEMYYPRECRYVVPANLPDNAYSEEKNRVFLEIAKFLEKNKIVMLKMKDSKTVIIPNDNIYDVVQLNVNTRYELISISIILGVWNIEVTDEKRVGSMVMVEGARLMSNKSPLYEFFIKMLPVDEKRDYVPAKMRWEISKKKDKESVVETVLNN